MPEEEMTTLTVRVPKGRLEYIRTILVRLTAPTYLTGPAVTYCQIMHMDQAPAAGRDGLAAVASLSVHADKTDELQLLRACADLSFMSGMLQGLAFRRALEDQDLVSTMGLAGINTTLQEAHRRGLQEGPKCINDEAPRGEDDGNGG